MIDDFKDLISPVPLTIAGLVVFGLILLGAGYYFQQNSADDSDKSQTELTEIADSTADEVTEPEKMYVVDPDDDETLLFRYPQDLQSTPEQLPVGFVNYLSGLLENNQAELNSDTDCITGYSVSMFSAEIVRGGQGSVPSSDSVSVEDCGGGGFTVWTPSDNGVWRELYGGQERPSCSVLEENDIPPEFEENCLGENGEGPFFNPIAPRGYEVVEL